MASGRIWISNGEEYQRGETAIAPETMAEIGKALTTAPEDFPLHKTVAACWKPRQRCSKPAQALTGPQAKRWPSARF